MYSFVDCVYPFLTLELIVYAENEASLPVEEILFFRSPCIGCSILISDRVADLFGQNRSVFNKVSQRFAMGLVSQSNSVALHDTILPLQSNQSLAGETTSMFTLLLGGLTSISL